MNATEKAILHKKKDGANTATTCDQLRWLAYMHTSSYFVLLVKVATFFSDIGLSSYWISHFAKISEI